MIGPTARALTVGLSTVRTVPPTILASTFGRQTRDDDGTRNIIRPIVGTHCS